MMKRRDFLRLSGGVGAAAWTLPCVPAQAAAFVFEPTKSLIPAPATPADWSDFRRQLEQWRTATRASLNYSGALYERPDLAWTARCFSCAFLMLCDEQFYDHRGGRWTPEQFLDEGQREFGGYDGIVLWHAYPRIGLDDRNQFDFYRDLPGGLPSLRDLTRRLQTHGLKVFVDYNPWDTGTRREGKDDIGALADLVVAIDADGIFLDTMDTGTEAFRARLDANRPGVALEGEIALPLDRVHDHHLSWAQGFTDSDAPGVLRNKWFEPRHMQHQIKRWDFDHSGELHTAWMNGSGILVWENVFGSWMGWSARDRSLLRAMLPAQRRYAQHFAAGRWTPLVPTPASGLYASLWELDGLRLWTLVNRTQAEIAGPLLDVDAVAGIRIVDVIRGLEAAAATTGTMTLSGTIPPRGLGCFVAGTSVALGRDIGEFLESMARLDARFSRDAAYPPRPVTLWTTTQRPRAEHRGGEMTEIIAADLVLTTEFRERECGFYESTPPERHDFPTTFHVRMRPFERRVRLARYAIDLMPVTNGEFAAFLRASDYRPRHAERFLAHWNGRTVPVELEDHPVVYVDLDDARAYAQWAGKRLPTEEEWQHAAQGPERLRYPWGPEMAPGRCNGGERGGTTPVGAFPDGRSPFGVYDLCGNVWEWTESERSDGRTRFALLKGGCWYTAKGSGWYFDGGPRPNPYVAKMLLMWPGLDRCATVGFRCARSLGA